MEITFTLANSAGTPLSSYAKNRPSGNCTRWAVTWGPLMLFSTFTGGGVMALYTNPTAAAINTKTNRRKSPVPSKKFHQNTLLITHLQENPTHLLIVDLIHFGSKHSRGCQILCFSSAHLGKKLQAKLGTCVSFFSHKDTTRQATESQSTHETCYLYLGVSLQFTCTNQHCRTHPSKKFLLLRCSLTKN